jgi:hypothetical protein
MNNELQAMAGVSEVTRLTGAGGGTNAFAAKIESNFAYNVYMVRLVEILGVGITPAELGDEMTAVNLSEPFNQQGQLQEGKYVLVCSVGDKNVFYAEP